MDDADIYLIYKSCQRTGFLPLLQTLSNAIQYGLIGIIVGNKKRLQQAVNTRDPVWDIGSLLEQLPKVLQFIE